MSFFSTRGGACATASQAILYGLAKDGGLFVPIFLLENIFLYNAYKTESELT